MFHRKLQFLAVLAPLVACSGGDDDKSAEETDEPTDVEPTDTTPTDVTDVTDTVPMTEGTYELVLFQTTTPLEGATLSIGDETHVTGSDGKAVFHHPKGEDFVAILTKDGYLDQYLYGGAPTGDRYSRLLGIPDEATLVGLGAALGLALDPNDTLLNVAVRELRPDGTTIPLAGATVSLDVAYDVALIRDNATPTGFNVGTTTLDTDPTSVYFVNSAAGQVTPTIVPPAGYTCAVFPGVDATLEITNHAGGVSMLTFACSPS